MNLNKAREILLNQCSGKNYEIMLNSSKFKNTLQKLYRKLWYINIPTNKPIVIDTFSHDASAFTQGLLFDDGELFESTGLIGHSSIRHLSLEKETPKKITYLPDLWGEGIASYANEIVQLTWKSQVAVVYQLPGLNPIREIEYQGEGWGLASFDDGFVMTDGSETLKFLNRDLEVESIVSVKIKGRPLLWLNDLTYAEGSLYINRLSDNYIYQVSPNTGKVERIIDCTQIVRQMQPLGKEDCLNGIAYSTEDKKFFITGKRWSKLFSVAF